jgi:hypothetical protein
MVGLGEVNLNGNHLQLMIKPIVKTFYFLYMILPPFVNYPRISRVHLSTILLRATIERLGTSMMPLRCQLIGCQREACNRQDL